MAGNMFKNLDYAEVINKNIMNWFQYQNIKANLCSTKEHENLVNNSPENDVSRFTWQI